MNNKKASLLLGLSVLIALGSFALGIIFTTSTQLRIDRLVNVINLQQASLVESAERNLESWSRDLRQHASLISNPCDNEVISVIDDDPRFTAYGLADLNGNVICTDELSKTQTNISDRLYFQEVIETQELSMSGFQIGRFSGNAVVAYAYPVFDDDNNLSRIAFLGISLDWVNQWLEELKLPSGAEVAMTDTMGHIEAYHPMNDELIGQQVFDPHIFSIMLSQKSGQIWTEGIDGVGRRYVYGPLFLDNDEEVDAFLLVGLPNRPIIDFSWHQPLILLSFSLLVIGAQWYLLTRTN